MDCRVFAVIFISFVFSNGVLSEEDCRFGKIEGLLEGGIDLFIKAKKVISEVSWKIKECPVVNCTKIVQPPDCPPPPELNCTKVEKTPPYVDCADILASGVKKSSVYKVWPLNRILSYSSNGVSVYCDMETDGGGWTVIQRRGDYENQTDFYRSWQSYREGFGSYEADFWLGNDMIHALTNQKNYSVRFDLKNVNGESRYAKYDTFWIEDESRGYTLHLAGFSGTAGDAMGYHNGMKFTTKDHNNSKQTSNCSVSFKGGWWYKACASANLNGLYKKGQTSSVDTVNWNTWETTRSLLETTIKIKPNLRYV